MCVCLSACVSVYLSLYLSACLCLSVSVCLPICVSVHLSVTCTQRFPDSTKPATPVEYLSKILSPSIRRIRTQDYYTEQTIAILMSNDYPYSPFAAILEMNTFGMCSDVTDDATVPKA